MGKEEIQRETATFAGGCFWCMEADFEKLEGVIQVISGYTGGEEPNPSYEDVSARRTGHVEAVQVIYDPRRIGYSDLLDHFWRHVDPTDPDGQFVDRGPQYCTAIFYHSEEQKRLAEASRRRLDRSGWFSKPVVTEIRPFKIFYPAEKEHQDYYRRSPLRYRFYRYRSGRDQFLRSVWENPSRKRKQASGDSWKEFIKPDEASLRRRLTPLQFHVTQENGTELPFRNEYWNSHRPGIYVDVVSGEPLFSSLDKFDSGTGWPSFTRPLEPDHVVQREDRSLFSTRMEIRSQHADSHLGHVFRDGHPPTGLRYCVNSAALRFIPLEELEKEGYGGYVSLFQEADLPGTPREKGDAP